MHISLVFFSVFAKMEVYKMEVYSSPAFGGMFRWLGGYGVTVLLAGFAVLVGACLVVALCKRPAVIAAYLPFVLLPLLIGIHGSVAGHYEVYEHFGRSEQIVASSLAAGEAESLHRLYLGIVATWPSFLVVAVGLFVRTLRYQGPSQKKASGSTTETPFKTLSG